MGTIEPCLDSSPTTSWVAYTVFWASAFSSGNGVTVWQHRAQRLANSWCRDGRLFFVLTKHLGRANTSSQDLKSYALCVSHGSMFGIILFIKY